MSRDAATDRRNSRAWNSSPGGHSGLWVMAIEVRLDRVLLERRMSLTDLSARVGVSLANLSVLKTGRGKAVRFSTLNAICQALHCQPGELLSYHSEPRGDADERT